MLMLFVSTVAADQVFQNDIFGGEWGMPFHPACFEIFKRVCLKKLGFVDIDGLWRVRDVSRRLTVPVDE